MWIRRFTLLVLLGALLGLSGCSNFIRAGEPTEQILVRFYEPRPGHAANTLAQLSAAASVRMSHARSLTGRLHLYRLAEPLSGAKLSHALYEISRLDFVDSTEADYRVEAL